ncbi:hypothetical protein SYNPS1DRAFT_25862 [Syncephalis pseudoplumigaleata]|uniref:Methyltransferase type 11 domain-containing protein n=1 Tax=Syncephalis pseudoplumigaleata TaxID=1712513 RepID=A0A4P9YRG2_9FUNG|nr:hypothetical protein SYNPS1DRAFT_25862 [Syncephalis pseudoplumigaleata]|eukprot:RKP22407.1 hypothetical protein SYNPS1DRAFT_25862 [Syncephalis pseudoplumigaleata]
MHHDHAPIRSKSVAGRSEDSAVIIDIAAAQAFVRWQQASHPMSSSAGDITPGSASSDASIADSEPAHKGRFRGLRHWLSDFSLKRSSAEDKHAGATSRLRHQHTTSSQSLRSRFNNLDAAAFTRRANSPLSTSSTTSRSEASLPDHPLDHATQMAAFLDANIYEYSDTLHHVLKYYLGRIFFAPVECAAICRAQRILNMDCGGTDTWTREVALMFPAAEVWNMSERTDDCSYSYQRPRRNSATFRLNTSSPSNVHHTSDKLVDVASWSGERFDYVHRRFLHPLLTDKRWSSIVPQMFHVCRPGGIVELASIGLDFLDGDDDPDVAGFKRSLAGLMRKAYLMHDDAAQLDQALMKAGFVDIKRQLHHIPCGEWGDLAGRLLEGVLRDAFGTMPDCPLAALSPADLAAYGDLVDTCLQRLTEWRAHFSVVVYTAQRPEQAFDDISIYPAV